jgi:hypothetical protein
MYFGYPVFLKTWEGLLDSTGWKTTISNFFPSPSCRIVSYGGECILPQSNEAYSLPTYVSAGWQRQVIRSGSDLYFMSAGDLANSNVRVWVKYTKQQFILQ